MTHLKSRSDIDLSGMDIDVGNVSFRKGEADATVSFRAKGSSDPGGAMTITYSLEEKNGKWSVRNRRQGASAADNPHGGAPPALPEGHPPTEGPGGAGAKK
jgi:hypothetical protein